MRQAILVFALLIAGLGAPAGAAALEKDPTLHCPPAPPGIVVDGKLTELIWQVSPEFPKFVTTAGRTPKEATQAWACYGKDGLYIAFSCEQARMSAHNSPTEKDVWTDDSVEVFIDADGDRATYDHFILSAAGAKMQERADRRGNLDRSAPLEWRGAAAVEDGRWTAEILIPSSTIGKKLTEGSVVRINLCRNNPAVNESSCWAAVSGGFHQPLAFGNLVMGVPPEEIRFSVDAGDKLAAGPGEIKAWCLNKSKSDVKLIPTLYPSGKELTGDKPLTVPSGKQLTVMLSADLGQPGRVNLRLVAVDAGTGATLAESSYGGQVTPAPRPPVGGVIMSGDWGTLWNCTGTYKVMRETVPPAATTRLLRVSAARNEFEPFQLVLRPKKKLTNVKVTPHTLSGPKGAKIDAWNVQCRNVAYVHVTEPTSGDVSAGAYPDPLPEFEPFTAPEGINSPVWVTVFVPAGTAPGDYKGTIDVTADGMNKLVVPVSVHVWDFELPSVSKLRTAYGLDLGGPVSYQGATTTEQMRKLVELYNRDFWRHRVAPYAPYTFYDIKASIENGQIELDFSDFDKAIAKFFPLFNSFNLPHFGKGDDLGLKMGSEYERLKIEYMRAVVEHLADKGQIGKAYNYIFDEPTEEQYDDMVEAAKLCRMADSRIKVLLTEQVEPKLIGSVDIWVPIINAYDEKRSKERQKAGEEVWWYVCCGPHHPYPNNFIDYPAIDQRILPWITWRYGVNGILYWQTTYWRDNPYETAMSYPPDGKGRWGNGDGRLLYPPVRKPSQQFVEKGPVPSIRWEMIREGIEDYDYFRILKDRVDKAGAGVAARAGGLEALKLVDSCAQSRTQYCQDPTRLEQVRAKVAEAIEALK